MIYYTADLHVHYALLLPSRPFATVEEMDEALVKNWNDTVGPEDTVYLVGDIGWNAAGCRESCWSGCRAIST